MKKLSILTLIALTIVFLDSCTTIKKRYSSGYTVVWNQKSKSKKLNSTVDLSSNKNKVIKIEETKTVIPNPSISFVSNALETEEVKAHRIKNVYETIEIENTIASNDESLLSLDLTTKWFKNSNDNIKSDSKAIESKIQNSQNEKKSIKKMKNSSQGEGDKSWVVALILCFFIGVLGIHRFYLGYTGLGVLYLLTGGLCGIGVLVDFIMLLTGSLKPKKGNFNDK
jgi:PBP1b-binding outer membrane lipoprotein LpoB